MAHVVPGPGSAPGADHDWLADFAEEEPDVPPRRHEDSSDAFDSFTPEAGVPAVRLSDASVSATRLIDPSSTLDDWSLLRQGSGRQALAEPREGGPVDSRAMRFVALAAGLAALAAWWIVPRLGGEVTVPNLPPQPAPLATAAVLPPPPPIDVAPAPPEAPPTAAAPEAQVSKPAASSAAPPAPPDVAPPAAREIATPATPEAQAARAAETQAIDAVLSRYRTAFGSLDANKVAEVWPGADPSALERTFAGLTFQSLEFDGCAIDVRDLDAQASCRGRARVVTKSSARTFLEPRSWDFILRKDDRGWVIRSVK